MTKITEENLAPQKFYSHLNLDQDESILKTLKSQAPITIFLDDVKVKKLLSKIVRNIRLIDSHYSDSREKRCKVLNYWVDGQINEYEKNPGKESMTSLKQYIDSVFNDIFLKESKRKNVCTRQENVYGTTQKELKKELDEFCENRESLKCNIWKGDDECAEYNNYIRQKKQIFTEKKTSCQSNDCHINDNCTLINLDLTFREINCSGLYDQKELQKMEYTTSKYTSLEIGFFIIVSLLLFFCIYLFLSKFTNIGSMIRNRLRKKNIINKNMETEDYEESLGFSSNSMPINSNDRSYYIEYNSLLY
ncbi:PIR Superfamily Protein [Plasmodium ovale wallikeri]|uniref:PIR Superfamily Protein n=1 Tax=Plasmodium ovale wallikeri TaxID=864142 RepID=A0A1A9AR11_PLAOA|nr:PIR Superfamily Protein [Plasmodium ovale wallikeri]